MRIIFPIFFEKLHLVLLPITIVSMGVSSYSGAVRAASKGLLDTTVKKATATAFTKALVSYLATIPVPKDP